MLLKLNNLVKTLYLLIICRQKCYQCLDVEGNWEDCIGSTVTCQPSQDASPPYWTVLNERRPFISKGCTTRLACAYQSSLVAERCTVSKTRDWSCVNCCTDDDCNYYVPAPISKFMSDAELMSGSKNCGSDRCRANENQKSKDNRARMVIETGFTYTGNPGDLADAIDNTFQGLSLEQIKIAKFLSLLPKKYIQPVGKFCQGERFDKYVACAKALYETDRNMQIRCPKKMSSCNVMNLCAKAPPKKQYPHCCTSFKEESRLPSFRE